MNEEMRFCQSCGMPMQAAGDFGTEADGSASADYCVYCYKNGAFTEACTLEQITERAGNSGPFLYPQQNCAIFVPKKTTNAN